ncbi:MAG: hypothetical protein ABI761_02735, partial [Saprospiraceae bacterium]
MTLKNSLLIAVTTIVASLIFFPVNKKSFHQDGTIIPSNTSPHMTLWRVDSMHLLDESKGTATLWPCGDEYYFTYHPNVIEDVIVVILNDGDADLNLSLPLNFDSGSSGLVNIIEQPNSSILVPGAETHFIIRYSAGTSYVHVETSLSVISNDPIQSACKIAFEVGCSGLDCDNDGDGFTENQGDCDDA